MSLSLAASASLVLAAQFGQAGFPTRDEVMACQEPVALVMAAWSMKMESEKPTDEQSIQFFDDVTLSYAKLLSWEQYYAGVWFDDAAFRPNTDARNQVLAQSAFAFLNEDTNATTDMAPTVEKAFECMAMTAPHPMVRKRDGSGGTM